MIIAIVSGGWSRIEQLRKGGDDVARLSGWEIDTYRVVFPMPVLTGFDAD